MVRFEKIPYYKYETAPSFESGTEYLRLFLPCERGFVNFNIIRSVRADAFADIFRLGQAFAYDDNLENEFSITPERAEWDMAIKIFGREDFIGGLIHGDEVSDGISVTADGKAVDITKLSEFTPFTVLKISIDSIGYDPDDHKTKVLLHKKEYTVDKNGITSRQRVEFLGDYHLNNSYLAMMPPKKQYTDSYFTDKAETPSKITREIREMGVRQATVFGEESAMSFTMAIKEYPDLPNGNIFLITDNSGNPYNKMYFCATTDYTVKRGDVFSSVTEYKISIG